MKHIIKDWHQESKRFNQAADYYDKYRPGYPEQIIDTIIRTGTITPDSRLLEK